LRSYKKKKKGKFGKVFSSEKKNLIFFEKKQKIFKIKKKKKKTLAPSPKKKKKPTNCINPGQSHNQTNQSIND